MQPANEPFRIHSNPQRVFALYFILAACEGLLTTATLVTMPADPKKQVLLGFSWSRLSLLAGVLLVSAIWVWMAWITWKRPRLAQGWFQGLSQGKLRAGLPVILAGVLLLGWIGTFLPAYRWGMLWAFNPLLVWITLLAAQALGGLYLFCYGLYPGLLVQELKQSRALLRASLTSIALFGLLWGLILWTKLGLTPDDRYWNEAGVPILGLQLLLVWVVSLLGGIFLPGLAANGAGARLSWLDWAVCLALWLLAALLWTQTPMARSHFAVGPYPPNHVLYPSSDAQIYDVGGQYLLIGQGLNNKYFVEKALYMFMLALFRLIAGQDYLRTVQLQAALLAIFPAILYLLGKQLVSRSAGLLVALISIFRETNSISSTLLIQVSNSRLMMTELPTAVGLAFLVLLLVTWFNRPPARLAAMLIGGGMLGALVMIRTNSLLLLPWILVLIMVYCGRSWKIGLSGSALVCLGAFLFIAPWMLVNRTPSGRTFLEEKIHQVIITRYMDPTPTLPATPPGEEVTPTPLSPVSPTPLPTDSPTRQPASTPAPAPPAPPSGSSNNVLIFAPAHFFHNQIMGLFILPLSSAFNDLPTELRAPYWDIQWDGQLTTGQILHLILNLAVLGVGLGAAWSGSGWAGLAPLVMLAAYFTSNAVARVSGSRYLVPVDWVVIFYFGLGLFQLTRWGTLLLGLPFEKPQRGMLQPEQGQNRPASALWSPRRVFLFMGLAALLLALGAALLFVGDLFPRRYAPLSSEEVLTRLLQRGSLQKAGIPASNPASLIASNGGVVLRGRALYPKFYAAEQLDACIYHPSFTGEVGYPRLVFQLIGPQSGCVVLPLDKIDQPFPDAVDVTVLGCQIGIDIHAQAIVIEGTPDSVFSRAPVASWTCPLPSPSCDASGICR